MHVSRTPARVTQADIARAMRAADQAWGAEAVVEVLPDGTIRIARLPEFKARESVRLDETEEIRL